MNNLFVNKRQVRQFLFKINVHCKDYFYYNEQRGKILSSLFSSFADDEETNITIFITILGKWVVYFLQYSFCHGRCTQMSWMKVGFIVNRKIMQNRTIMKKGKDRYVMNL